MKRFLTLLRITLLTVAWALFIAAATLIAIEESGILTEFVEARLAEELGSLGPRVHIERARLFWFEPGLVLEGITFDGEHKPGAGWREGRERLRLSSVHVRLNPSLDPRRPVESVEVRGGRVALAGPLLDAFQTLIDEREEPSDPPTAQPPISVRGIAVDLELPNGELFPLGSADFSLTDGEGGSVVRGRLQPSLGGAVLAPAAIHLEGETFGERGFAFHASARSLLVDSDRMQAGEARQLTGLEDFRGELALDLDAQFQPEVGSAPVASLRLSLRDGFLSVPEQPPVDPLDIRVDVDFAPEPGMSLWDPAAWAATARATGGYNRSDVEAVALFGTDASPDAHVEAWARVDDLHIDEDTMRAFLVHQLPADVELGIRETKAALDPRGLVDANLGFRIPRVSASPLLGHRELVVNLPFDGRTEMTFQGWKDENGDRRGMPIPCSDVRGTIVSTWNSALSRPSQLALVDMTADHGSGRVNAEGLISSPIEGDRSDLDILIRVPSMAVGPVLAEGLAGIEGTAWVWDEFNPANGEVAAEWRLRRQASIGGLTALGKVDVRDVDLVWRDVPVPLAGVRGTLELRWAAHSSLIVDAPPNFYGDPQVHRPVGALWHLETGPTATQSVRARGLVRGESLAPEVTLEEIPKKPMQWLEVELDDLLLRGDDWTTLTSRFPELGDQVKELRAQGSADVTYRGAQVTAVGDYLYDVEVTLRDEEEVALTPKFFGRQTTDVVGRVLVHGRAKPNSDKGEVDARFALFGAWNPGVTLASFGTIPATGSAQVTALGAGVDPASPTLKGVLISSFGDGSGDRMDLSAVEIDGRLDFAADVTFVPGTEIEPISKYSVFLRDNRLRSEAFGLESMHGVFVQEGDVLRSPRLRASLAGTPLELSNVLILSLEAARTYDGADPGLSGAGSLIANEGIAVQADWSAAGVALDREHLSPFVDEETLDLLLDRTGLSGVVDIRDARVLVISDRDGRDRVAFRGEVTPRDVHLTAGLPMNLLSGTIVVEELVLEAGRVRGWWRVNEMDSVVAGRRVENAEMTMTFVDGRLTVDNLRGNFGSGMITSLGGGETTDRAIAVDMSEPFGYAVAVRLAGVEVDELLGGLFESSVTDLGDLTTTLRLHGQGSDVMSMGGGGAIRLDRARLWSIPVIRELFRSLGTDESAVFDRMEMRWGLENGTAALQDISVRSPLLQLVGEGTVELTGEVKADLQVRFSLVDKLGYLNRIVYWFNNSLWQVALRGDLSRPQVLVRNSIFEFLFGFDDDPPRGLPLPGWSPLSSRF